jgi:uncharacterized membrane protein YebE (DUF533 family)
MIMKKLALIFTISIMTYGLMGCDGSIDKQDMGMAAGAVAGGVIGSQFGSGTGKTAATIGGAVVGGYVGRELTKD